MNARLCDYCDRPHAARGMCQNHYAIWKRRRQGIGPVISPDEGVDEYERLVGELGFSPTEACRELDRHPRSVIRWYERTSRLSPVALRKACNDTRRPR